MSPTLLNESGKMIEESSRSESLGVDQEGSTAGSRSRTEYPAGTPSPQMTIYYHGVSVTLSEQEVFDFSFTLGVAKRSKENYGAGGECIRRARKIWTRLGIWTVSDD